MNHPLPLSDAANVGIIENGQERVVSIGELCARLDVDALIRLHRHDFGLIRPEQTEFVHFNLEFISNEVGRHYAIVPIVRAGRRSAAGMEILPVIDPMMARRALCTEIIQHLSIGDVTAAQFTNSLPNIRSASELGDALLRRYRRMFPDNSADDLLSRGCTLTRLALLTE